MVDKILNFLFDWSLADFTLRFGKRKTNQEKINARSAILAAGSPVMSAALESEFKVKGKWTILIVGT